MKRREFLKVGAGSVISAPFIFSKKSSLWAAGTTSKIAIASDPLASSFVGSAAGTDIWSYTVNAAAINAMVDNSIKALTGKATVGDAWETIVRARVGSLSTSTKIGIKINTAYVTQISWAPDAYPAELRSPYGPRGEIVNAVISGLHQMLGGTFPVQNITVFDRISYIDLSTKMVANGFPAGGDEGVYDVGGADGQFRVVLIDPPSTSAKTFSLGPFGPNNKKVTQYIIPEVFEQNTWINIALPKVNIGSGITGVLKNCYGMTNRCSDTHTPETQAIIHDCVPRFYQEIDNVTPCALNILDALAGNYAKEAYLGPSFIANKIAMSTDPVTTDFFAAELINEAREANGWTPIKLESTTADRYAMAGAAFPGTINVTAGKGTRFTKYVNCHSLAVGEQIGIGFMNAGERIMVNPVSNVHQHLSSLDLPHGRPMNLVRQGNAWSLNVQLDNSGRVHRIESNITDVKGRTIKSFSSQVTRSRTNNQTWNGKSDSGLTVADGLYCWRVNIDGVNYSQPIQCR